MGNLGVIFGILSGATLLSFLNTGNKADAQSHFSADKKLGGLNVLQFAICTSWGYRNAVNQYAQLVRQRFPEDELKIEVTNYPVDSTKALLAQALSLAKFAFLGIVIANIQVHTMLGMEQPPQFLIWAWENKGYACMMAFFIGNAIENGLTSTGAFEIYLSGDKMWSKLESGRIPSQGEFMKMINDNMALEAGTFDNQF